MGLSHNPNIVTNGLVLCLDAANRRSYPGAGTAWTDLSGNNNHATLINGPIFNNINTGNIIFDGTNDLAQVNHNTILNPTSNGITFGGLFKVNSSPASGYFPTLINKSDGDWSNGYRIGPTWPYNGTFSVGVSEGSSDGVNRALIISTSTTPINTWVNIYGTWDAPNKNLKLYFNGIENGSKNTTNSLTINPISNLELCRYNRSSLSRYEYISASIAQFLLYSRALTADEILQNYKATRKRFGL